MEEKKVEYDVDFYTETIARLRIKLRDSQDSMDVISFAIRSLEADLAKLQEEQETTED